MKTAAPPFDATVGSLVWPLAPKAFLERVWGKKPFVAAARPGRLERLIGALGTTSVEELVHRARGDASVWTNDADGRHHSTTPGSIRSAIELHRGGLTIYLNNFDRYHEVLSRWSNRLVEELGAFYAAVDIFAVHRGTGTAGHFDKFHNFTIQLTGRKVWRIAPNRQLQFPTTNHVLGARRNDELRHYAIRELPGQMPPRSRRVVLRAGALLYLPPGYLHQTEESHDSLTLSFRLSDPPLLDVVLPAIRDALLKRDHWRRPAGALWGRGPLRDTAAAEARRAFARLAAEVAEAALDDVLDVRPDERASARRGGRADRWRRRHTASLVVERVERGAARLDLTVGWGGRTQTTQRLTVPGSLVPVCTWVSTLPSRRTFSLEELQTRFPDVTSHRLRNLLGKLAEAHVLRPS